MEQLFLSFNDFFGKLFEKAPLVWGSKWPVFGSEILLIIVLFDLLVFGWRPLVKKLAPEKYPAVDYWFGQTMNLLMAIVLVGFTLYTGTALGASWGEWLSVSGFIWSTVVIIALLFIGRFIVSTTGSRVRKA